MDLTNYETIKNCVDKCKKMECEKPVFKNGFCEECYKKSNQVQTILIINFEADVSEDKRQEIVNKIYLDNEKQIYGMTAHELKKGLNLASEVQETIKGDWKIN